MSPRRSWARACSTPRTRTALGTVGLQSGDYTLAGFDEADVVIAIGYDLVEHSPEHWNPKRDKKIICIDSVPAEIDEYFIPEVELIGDIYHILTRLGEECRHVPHQGGSRGCATSCWAASRPAKDDDAFPMQPPRALYEIRQALGREDILISRRRPAQALDRAHVPGLRAEHGADRQRARRHGLRGAAAIAAKLVHPDRNVVTVNGDGGFLMNCQELETAVRLKTPFVNVIWENQQYGSIVWKQDKKFGRHFGIDFTNPDFVKLAEALRHAGLALRVGRRLRASACATRSTLDVPSLIVLPIDYSIDVAIIRGTRNGDRGDMSIATEEQTVVDEVPKQLYIGGEWRDASGGGTLAVEDPATEETICEVADAHARGRRRGARRRRRRRRPSGRPPAARARRDPAAARSSC